MSDRRGCYECGESQDVRNGYLVKHNKADGATCPGSKTVGATLTSADRNRD